MSISLAVSGCESSGSNLSTSTAPPSSTVSGKQTTFVVDIWVDNWFSLYVNGVHVDEDIEPITQERSFNAQSVEFTAIYPVTVAVITKDFMENESGLEYIGTDKQQLGDGGFIMQIREKSSGNLVGSTSPRWSTLTIQRAPLNFECVSSSDPLTDCRSEVIDEPSQWQSPTFDDSNWSKATVYSSDEVKPKLGFDEIDWDPSASLVWGVDLKMDNILLWRTTFTQP